jgi:hypothetical protein
MENSETFGWQVAAEVHRRGLDRAERKACVCDGQLSQDDRWKRYWARPRKHRRAAGTGRLAQGV